MGRPSGAGVANVVFALGLVVLAGTSDTVVFNSHDAQVVVVTHELEPKFDLFRFASSTLCIQAFSGYFHPTGINSSQRDSELQYSPVEARVQE